MKRVFFLLAVCLAAVVISLPVSASEASPAGTWKWSVQGRQGNQGFEQTLQLQFQAGKLTGKLLGMQGGRLQIPDTEISEASFQDGVVKFAVTREFNGMPFTTRYEGRLAGDVIKGTYERPGFNGGETVKREWEARRAK